MTRSTALRGFTALVVLVSASGAAVVQEAPTRLEWNILALRVDFALEEPDQLSTTGTGRFDLRDFFQAAPEYAFPYDTPPHDRHYFEHHLDALARYYDAVSEGTIAITYQVFPRQQEAAYTLPEPALTYGNGRSEEEIGAKWAQLLADAVALADADVDGPAFSEYQSFLVFHAGVGHETGLLNDIRSVYLSTDDLSRHRPEPIEADSGRVRIRDGWILPEATSFQGQGGLNGLLAKFFGHQLGLPGLSNFADGLPALGGWSLMDIGANNLGFVFGDSLQVVVGFVPSHPMAWSKARLGWIEPVVVRRDTTIAIVATDRRATLPKAVRIPITPTEYFLLENRQQRGNRGLPEGADERYANADVVWIDAGDVEFSGDNNTGVWLGVPEQDAFVPGSGILIWHVDEGRIADRILDGSINNDPVRPGIVLEEADGYRDIGNPVFDRLSEIEGSVHDPFFTGGNERFAGDTLPDSRSNSGHHSGIEVVVRSAPADTMWVEVRFAGRQAGWPRALEGVDLLQAFDVDGDGALELLVGKGNGMSVLEAGDPEEEWNLAGARLLASADAAADGSAELFTSSGNQVSAWDFRAAEPRWSTLVDGSIGSALYSSRLSLFPGQGVLALAGDDGLTLLGAADGELLRRDQGRFTALAAADLDGDGEDELWVGGEAGLLRVDADGLLQVGASESVTGLASGDLDGDGRSTVVAVPMREFIEYHGDDASRATGSTVTFEAASVADIDGDGFLEFVLVADEQVDARRRDMTRQANFPLEVMGTGNGQPAATLADLTGDGAQDLVLASSLGVRGFRATGEQLPGFPLLTSAAITLQPVAADLDGDGRLELAAADATGIYVWKPDRVTGGSAAWGQRGQSAAGTHAHPRTTAPEPVAGSTLLPDDRVYVYPNPVAGDGPAHLRFDLGAPARVRVEVFDSIGGKVQRLSRDATQTSLGENEIRWETTDYPSGLYILRVTAEADDGGRESAMVRLAVIR